MYRYRIEGSRCALPRPREEAPAIDYRASGGIALTAHAAALCSVVDGRMSQTCDMTTLTVTPTTKPKITSAILCSPCTMPIVDESLIRADAMTTAAVIGA